MHQPYLLFIATRYLRAPRANRFASFVSLTSLVGIALGVAALIIVLSVMNGFEREVTRHVLGMSAHAAMVPPDGRLADWQRREAPALAFPGVSAIAPYVRGSGMLGRRGEVRGVVVEGIDPAREAAVSDIARYVPPQLLSHLQPGADAVLIGSALARELDAAAGDWLTLMLPDFNADGSPRAPRYARVRVGGTFHVGMHQYDARLMLMPLQEAAAALGLGADVSGLRVRFERADIAPVAVRELARSLGGDLHVIDWTQYHRNFFLALKSQKRILFVILVLIVGVAAFNVAASMVMVVTEKMHAIAILRTLGVTRPRIVALFLLQGLLVGVAGTVIGAAVGAWGAAESEAVARAIEALVGVDLINAEVYFIDYLPADLRPLDVLAVTAASVTLALLATVYPALRAAAVDPARALHRD